ncbi:DUF2935 domain-containing protein [Bacillus sp. FJAT-49732]|uniref:DUF2935 domain-containing protein n=1 Tax=Lederbergia citrisecunda TaxID=2833583 RepID=A0A942TL14_9BACI|nr:DUF2935 domain-containing protein [Lederbergia citrisecunda]MBS4199403.1 DUF2935 domain-containing protein [Lederbergia citrisecunda]
MSLTLNELKFEHEFWLQILGDHSRFILDSLAPSETKDIELAQKFKNTFDQLLAQARQLTNIEEAIILTANAKAATIELKKFKLSLLEKLLFKKIKFHLSSSFVNHMVNELEEYERLFGYFLNKESPPISHELHHHLLWLSDAAGHAGAIQDQLDATEKMLKKESATFLKDFEHLYLKAVEFAGYLRTHIYQFPALSRLNSEAKLEIQAFQIFLNEIMELEISEEVLGTFQALMADHMFREECYYLTKLAQSTNSTEPDCDPTSPRINEQ